MKVIIANNNNNNKNSNSSTSCVGYLQSSEGGESGVLSTAASAKIAWVHLANLKQK